MPFTLERETPFTLLSGNKTKQNRLYILYSVEEAGSYLNVIRKNPSFVIQLTFTLFVLYYKKKKETYKRFADLVFHRR